MLGELLYEIDFFIELATHFTKARKKNGQLVGSVSIVTDKLSTDLSSKTIDPHQLLIVPF